MLLSAGENIEIRTGDIISILNLDNGISADIRALAEKNGRLDVAANPSARSMIVTLDNVYLSPVSANTLRRRIDHDIRLYG